MSAHHVSAHHVSTHRSTHRSTASASPRRPVQVPAPVARDLHHDRLPLEHRPVQASLRLGRLVLRDELDEPEPPGASVARVPHSLRPPHFPEPIKQRSERVVRDVVRQGTHEQLARVDLVPVAAAAATSGSQTRSRARTPGFLVHAELAEKVVVFRRHLLVRASRRRRVVLEGAVHRGVPAVAADLARHQLRRGPVPGARVVNLRERHARGGCSVAERVAKSSVDERQLPELRALVLVVVVIHGL